MIETLCVLTAVVCVGAILAAYIKYRDPFHPAIILLPMCMFIYVVMPMNLAMSGELWAYLTQEQAQWVQSIVLGGMLALIAGLFQGSQKVVVPTIPRIRYRREVLQNGGYVLGCIGLLAWAYTMRNDGGFLQVFGRANGRGWSEVGYIRETVYLMIVGLLLLLPPEVYAPGNKVWLGAVAAFSVPFMLQGLLGAQRGPTFLITTTLAVSWYMARKTRPSLLVVGVGGLALGVLLLLLVTNRSSIYIGSEEKLNTDVSGMLAGNEANEYIFGAACMIASNQTGEYFWGRRYLAQLVVRPVPRQIWPTKYVDFGVPELEVNAGVAKAGLESVMGWKEVPGAAGAVVADLWVEFSWLVLPVLWAIGYTYGSIWRKATVLSGPWNTQYTIMMLLSIYLVTQSGEAVIFRMVILSLPSWWVWRKAQYV